MKLLISNSTASAKSFLDRIQLVQGDIAQQKVDAICTVIPQNLAFRGRLNESLNQTCNGQLDAFILDNIFKPRAGEVYALPAFGLEARHILVGVVPAYRTNFDMKESDLAGIVRKMMELARCMLLSSIAVPPIMSGKKGFPKAKAARLICQGVSERMQESFDEARIVCNDPQMIDIFTRKLEIIGWDGHA
ncbi:MAG: macro domain-containing protein [Alphaproteobacteria bacterium]